MTPDFGAARLNMVENQVRTNDVTDLAIQDAMRVVERERFCPPGKAYLAYAEAEVEYAPGWFLMAPREVSKLLQAIGPRPGERALAIAAPYAAAVMAEAGLTVDLRLPKGGCALVEEALAGASGVSVSAGDLLQVADGGPYDVIVCEGGVCATPEAWAQVLALGGRMGVVERRGPVGRARLFVRDPDGALGSRDVFDAAPPLMPGFGPVAAFAF